MNYYDEDAMAAYMQARGIPGGARKRFDEYYRCYPTVMLPGPEREEVNYGGKIFMPPSALDKLSKLHVTWPIMLELFNGQTDRTTHAGILEFIAEEGKVFMPHWMMQALLLETGDLVQVKTTDLPSANLVKLQPQDVNFLDISDPKAVLEKAFRGFSALTKGDIFTFQYNDTLYDVAVLEVKPETGKLGVSMLETDVSVDFAAPIGYKEPQSSKTSGTSTPRSVAGLPAGGTLHHQGTMAQAINYDAIAPSNTAALAGAKAASSNFLLGGHKLNSKKNSKTPTPKASTPVAGTSTNATAVPITRRTNGPMPMNLPPNKLFFGYHIKPLKTQADKDKENADALQPHFAGQGLTLKDGKKRNVEDDKGKGAEIKKEDTPGPGVGRRLDGRKI